MFTAGKELEAEDEYGNDQTLKDYEIKNLTTIYVVIRLRGGSNDNSIHQPKEFGADVQLTDETDMFLYDGPRAKMPCGHAVTPDGLTAYCINALEEGKFQFWCPYKPSCDTQWDFYTVKRYAALTAKELEKFENKMAENYLRKAVGIQDCPGCGTYCERKNKTDKRVICPLCTKQAGGKLYEFCWYCLNTWVGSGTDKCGNTCCTGEDPRMLIIKKCKRKTVVDVPNCPEVRACPACGILIEHVSACKHMHCPCGQKFCFICLKKANSNGAYQCGAFNDKCEVAAIQTTLPGN